MLFKFKEKCFFPNSFPSSLGCALHNGLTDLVGNQCVFFGCSQRRTSLFLDHIPGVLLGTSRPAAGVRLSTCSWRACQFSSAEHHPLGHSSGGERITRYDQAPLQRDKGTVSQ